MSKAFTAAALVSQLIADNLEAEFDVLEENDREVAQMLIDHLRRNQFQYAHNALAILSNRTVH